MKNLIYLLPILGIVGIGLLVPRVIKISDLRCGSQFGPCSPEIATEVARARGKSLYDTKEYLKRLNKIKRVVKYSTRFSLPNKLVVDVIERKAFAAIEANNTYTLIDNEGVVLGTASTTNLPIVKSETRDIDDRMLMATQLMSDVSALWEVKMGNFTRDYLQVDGIEGKSVIFPVTGERDLLIGSLRFILSRLKVESFDPRINFIDLRYKNPVLKYGQK